MSVSSGREYTGSEIAVIGMSGRFLEPKLAGILGQPLQRQESISFFSEEELLEAGIDPDTLRHPNFVKAKGMLDDIEYFDPEFSITPRAKRGDGSAIPPSARMLLGSARTGGLRSEDVSRVHRALYRRSLQFPLVHAGIQRAGYGGGIRDAGDGDAESSRLYGDPCIVQIEFEGAELHGADRLLHIARGRASGLPRLAQRGVQHGACRRGVDSTAAENGYFYQEGMINSPDGHCRAFDEQAAGTVFETARASSF